MSSKAIWNFLKNKGLSDYAVAGIMGNLQAESALNPKNLQNSYQNRLGYTDDSYTAAVDNGSYRNFVHDSAGYGLAQWTYWSRKESLLKFAQKSGASIGSLDMQLEFLYQELKGYTAVFEVLRTARTIREASDAVLIGYEKPANQGESAKKKRAEYGQRFYNEFAGQPTVDQNPRVPYLVKVSIDNLIIRTGPGTNHSRAGGYTGVGVFTIVDEAAGQGSSSGWGKLKSGAGWIALDYCSKLDE